MHIHTVLQCPSGELQITYCLAQLELEHSCSHAHSRAHRGVCWLAGCAVFVVCIGIVIATVSVASVKVQLSVSLTLTAH